MQCGANGGNSRFEMGYRSQHRLRVDACHGFAHPFALPQVRARRPAHLRVRRRGAEQDRPILRVLQQPTPAFEPSCIPAWKPRRPTRSTSTVRPKHWRHHAQPGWPRRRAIFPRKSAKKLSKQAEPPQTPASPSVPRSLSSFFTPLQARGTSSTRSPAGSVRLDGRRPRHGVRAGARGAGHRRRPQPRPTPDRPRSRDASRNR